LTVTNNDGEAPATCSGCFTVNGAPTVASTSPSSRGQGATNQNVTVTGTNFVNGAAASFSGTGITVNSTTFVNSSHLTANITISSGATTGARNVNVTNNDGSAPATCSGCFTVNSGPTVTSVSPSSVAHGTTQNVTVNGTNFASGATVSFSGGVTVNSVTFVDSGHLTVNLTTGNGSQKGTYSVSVANPDAGTGTCNNCFTVT
jgi:hypothetical protein